MDVGTLVQGLVASSVTATVIYGLALLSFLDFATGVSKALSIKGDGWLGTSFKLVYFDTWVKSKATKLINIILVLIVGAAMPDLNVLGFDIAPVTSLGVAWAGTFAVALMGSIKDNATPSDRTAVPEEVANP